MVKLSFFNLQVTNVKLKNNKLHLELLTGKQNFDLETVITDFFYLNDVIYDSEYLKRNWRA